MAAQNVCRYFKFGHCKFGDTCRLLHNSEKCENVSCEITSCKLRHPRTCKFFREFKKCKFSEWCSFKHIKTDQNIKQFNNKEIMEKIDDLAQTLKEKYDIINILVEKVRTLEETINYKIQLEDKNESIKS